MTKRVSPTRFGLTRIGGPLSTNWVGLPPQFKNGFTCLARLSLGPTRWPTFVMSKIKKKNLCSIIIDIHLISK